MDIINANIKFIRKQKGMTQQKFADAIGIKRSSLGAYEEGRAKPNYKTIKVIADKFNLTLDKLLSEDLAKIADQSVFGSSSPANSQSNANPMNAPMFGAAPSNKSRSNIRTVAVTVNDDGIQNVEVVTAKARAGYLAGYNDPQYIEGLNRIHFPFFIDLKGGTYRAFEISGDSMLPLPSGSFVIGEYVENWNSIKSGDTYVVISPNEGLVYKRVMNSIADDNTLILKSDNPEYPPYRIHINDVEEVWQIKAFICNEFPSTVATTQTTSTKNVSADDLMSKFMELQNEVHQMKKKLKN